MKILTLTSEEVEAARMAGMTPVEYATAKIRWQQERARRRAAALKGWATRQAKAKMKGTMT